MAKARREGFAYWHEAALILLLLVVAGMARLLDPSFLKWQAQVEMSSWIWEMALLALAMTLIIITGGIDLSVGATMSLAAVAMGMSHEAHLAPVVCILLAIAAGSAAGLLNGVFIAHVKVHPLIVTLATMSAFYGIAEGVSSARPIPWAADRFTETMSGSAGVPVPALIFLVAAAIAAIFLAKTVPGRALYAMGLNETASRFTGIAVDKLKLWLYMISGSAAGMAAVMFVTRRNTAKADIGSGMELDVITAVVLGGTSIYGGRGRIVGTMLGVLLIHETRQFVSWHWGREELKQIVVGALLIVAVLINVLFTRKRSN